jgi:endonuclease III
MEKPTIKTVEVVRRIRDAHYEQLKNKTRAERIAFYRHKSQSLYEKAQKLLQTDHDTIHAETAPQDKR